MTVAIQLGRNVAAVPLCPSAGAVRGSHQAMEETPMLWTIAVILLILWLLGAFVVPVGGALIHLLLVIALIVVIVRLVTGRRPVV
jgi:hypothetical protein